MSCEKGSNLILFGTGSHVAQRMSSLLPEPHGCGTRNNDAKRQFVLEHLGAIEYRTLPCASVACAKECERELKAKSQGYQFQT